MNTPLVSVSSDHHRHLSHLRHHNHRRRYLSARMHVQPTVYLCWQLCAEYDHILMTHRIHARLSVRPLIKRLLQRARQHAINPEVCSRYVRKWWLIEVALMTHPYFFINRGHWWVHRHPISVLPLKKKQKKKNNQRKQNGGVGSTTIKSCHRYADVRLHIFRWLRYRLHRLRQLRPNKVGLEPGWMYVATKQNTVE